MTAARTTSARPTCRPVPESLYTSGDPAGTRQQAPGLGPVEDGHGVRDGLHPGQGGGAGRERVQDHEQPERRGHMGQPGQSADVLGLRKRLTFLRPASRLLGTAPMAEVTADGIVIERDGLDRATELVAVCRK